MEDDMQSRESCGPLTNLLYHLHDCPDGSLWLVNFDIVIAVVCNHLLTIRGQVEQFDLHGLPVRLFI